MLIFVDCDNTLNDLAYKLIDLLNSRYGCHADVKKITRYQLEEAFPTLTKEQLFEPLRQEWFWRLYVKPLPDAVTYLKRLIDDGHKVYVVTASDTEEELFHKAKNLFYHFPYLSHRDLLSVSNKQLLKGDVIIDDYPKNLEGENCALRILKETPFNREFRETIFIPSGSYHTAGTWEEIYRLVSDFDRRTQKQ